MSKYSMTKAPQESHIRWDGDILLCKKNAANKPKLLEKESLTQIGAAYILTGSLKVGPEIYA